MGSKGADGTIHRFSLKSIYKRIEIKTPIVLDKGYTLKWCSKWCSEIGRRRQISE